MTLSDTFTGTSISFDINGMVNVAIGGDTLNTKIEYQPHGFTDWFPLQVEIGTDTVVTAKSVFNVTLPRGNIRFNGGTSVTVIVTPETI